MVLNNKKRGISISKVLLVMFSLLVMISSVSAYTYETDYDTIQSDFGDEDLVFQHANNLIYPSEGNAVSNVPLSFILTTKPLYVMVQPTFENITMNINTPDTIPVTINLTKGVQQYIQINPSYSGEYITLNFPDEYITYDFYMPNDNDRETSLLTLVQPFTSAITDLVSINISIWRLGFFIFIVIIPLAFLSLIVWGIFKLIEWARHLSEVKEDILKGRDRRN